MAPGGSSLWFFLHVPEVIAPKFVCPWPEHKWHQDTTSWRSSFSRCYRTHATGKVNPISTIDRNSPLRFNWNAPRYSFRSNKIIKIQCKPYGWASQICSIHPEVVKSELRYPIIQVIRSQWESQDLPTFQGNQYHVTDDTASQEQGYNICAPNQG